ncbi:hypothetical protein ALC56_09319 [Trachymyrmex septentrionalis]|uniref:Uncharacterized protein n=1 Tax=Trachymyrmex septentrionalis TaxID=34720 RepID=A0A195F8H3_9HYME|nr:hypothetical protein ALC56_09319 [Trachymyrmex septentrionalis]
MLKNCFLTLEDKLESTRDTEKGTKGAGSDSYDLERRTELQKGVKRRTHSIIDKRVKDKPFNAKSMDRYSRFQNYGGALRSSIYRSVTVADWAFHFINDIKNSLRIMGH